MVAITAEWLIAYALHSTVLLTAVYVLERLRLFVEIDVRETAWRTALFGALLTASLQTAFAPPANAPAAAERVSVVGPTVVAVEAPVGARAHELSSRPEQRVSQQEKLRAERPGAVDLQSLTQPDWLTVPIDLRKDAIALAWCFVAAAGISLLIWQLIQVRRRCAGAALCVERGVHDEVAILAARARVQIGAIRQIEGATSPMVIPPALLCIPDWALTDLDALRRRAMLAHEIAHLMRRDQWWRLVYQAFLRLMFFQPLNRLAVRRLETIAELACDDWAARATTRRAAAECLAACGERIAAQSPLFASTIVRSDSTLVERIRTVLHERRRLAGRVIAARGVLVLALVGVMTLPVVVFQAPAQAEVDWSVRDLSGSGVRKTLEFNFGRLRFEDVTTLKVRQDGTTLGARLEGPVRFADSEDSVVALEGRAVIEEVIVGGARHADERRVEVESTDSGISHRYTVNGLDQPFEPAGRAFMVDAVPTLLRETAYDADHRIAKIIEKGGQEALLEEVSRIETEWSRGKYLAKLAERERLDGANVTRALMLTAPIQSDYVRRTTLVALLKHQDLTSEQQAQVFDLVADTQSDYEQRLVLVQLVPKLHVEDASLAAAWQAALETVDSDFEARVAIIALAERNDLTPSLVEAAIKATTGMGSDYEARVALAALVPHLARMPTLASAYADSTRLIASDYEHRRALTLLADAAALDAAGFKAVLAAAENIDSRYECNRLLQVLTADLPADADAVQGYRRMHDRCGGTRI